MDLTQSQLEQLKSLGISISKDHLNTSESTQTVSTPPSLGKNKLQTISSSSTGSLLKPSINPVIPLLSISGLTLLSFGGLVLFKGKETTTLSPDLSGRSTQRVDNVPTQVPKSIQHYLLTSQQFFTKALSSSPEEQVELVNQSILAATQATKDFPQDYRGYEQRGRLYQSLIDNNPDLLKNAIADLSSAHQLNPNSAEITRTLATLFARSGDINNTLNYLSQTVNLEPTKAQNFYDLARLQTQAGYVPQALDTYTRLLTIVADPTQKQHITLEKESLEKLASQNTNTKAQPPLTPFTTPQSPVDNSPLLQADNGTGLIIAAPETSKDISVKSLTDSNSLSGVGSLPANTSQISITNSNITSDSLVYLTITKGGKNQSLQIISKSTGSFTAGLDSPISEDIEFKWWIVN
jgi:hypothetical protein